MSTPTLTLVALICLTAGIVKAGEHTVTAEALSQRINDDNPPFILDVRTAEEYAAGHLPGAVNIPYDELPERIGELPATSEEVVVYCRTGRRAEIAEATLKANGYTNLRELVGHWIDWPKK